MALEEKVSKHLGVKYIYLPEKKLFLCENGVPFTLEEYRRGIDLQSEYERRKYEGKLFDYMYAKNTHILRKKRGYVELQAKQENNENVEKRVSEIKKVQADNSSKDISRRNTGDNDSKPVQREISSTEAVHTESRGEKQDIPDRRVSSGIDKPEAKGFSVMFIVALLGFTSLISGYISTLHTATYLYDYVDMISAWLMSSSVTAYNATAFEVSVIFKSKKRYGLTFVFITLWGMVTLFSMATTVSVFYDRFNFTEAQIAQENKQSDSNKLALELLRTKEKDIREAIEFKKKDIEYRQEKDYATTAVRAELNDLQTKLQENLTEQENLLKETPEITEKVTKRKESLFSFLGRLMHLEGGILEFIMSTMSAIFINLISPLSLTAVTELLKNNKQTLTK